MKQNSKFFIQNLKLTDSQFEYNVYGSGMNAIDASYVLLGVAKL
jgi:hypothetical protein